MAPEAPVSALTAGDTLLAHFWDLASLEEGARQSAANALVDALIKDQRDFEGESGAEQSEEEDEAVGGACSVGHALRRCSPLMVYAFKRLCRGLGSSRQGARQGFSLAVTALLASTSCISPGEAVTAIEGVLEVAGKGSELRDALLGRMFGYAAVVRSGQPVFAELAASMAAGLVQAAKKKSFLREASAAVMLELCEAADDSTLAALVEGARAPLVPWLTAPPADASPETLLLALHLWPRLPAAAAQACPLLPLDFQGGNNLPAGLFTDTTVVAGNKAVAAAATAFFTQQHLTTLLPVLRVTTQSHPRLHSVWTTLLALLMPGFSADKDKRSGAAGSGVKAVPAVRPLTSPLEAFWGCVVEGDLVPSSHERKYLAFTLFLLLLPHLGPEHVPLVFTPSFLRCLSTNLKKGDSYLHAGAKKCMERIAGHCGKAAAPEVRIAVSLALQRHGGTDLERFARKAAAGNKANNTKAEDGGGGGGSGSEEDGAVQAAELKQYVQQLQAAFVEAGSAADGAAAKETGGGGGSDGTQQRQWAVEQLCGMLKQAAVPPEVKHQVLRFLALHAFFTVDTVAAKKSKDTAVEAVATHCVNIPLAHRQLCAARLISLADTLDKQQQQHGKGAQQQQGQQQAAPVPTQQQQQQEYVGGVVAFASKLHESSAVQLATAAAGEEEAAEAAEAAAATLLQTLQRLQTWPVAGAVPLAKQQQLRALTHLLRLLLLHSLADPASADPGLAADLNTVVAVAVEGKAALQRQQGQEQAGSSSDEEAAADDAGEQPYWHDTLMDVLLSLLARNAAPLPSAPLRDAVEHVFGAFAEDLTTTGMADMLRVLTKPLDSSGPGQGGSDDVYASSEEEEEGEGEMEVDGEEASEREDEGEGSSSSEGEDEERPVGNARAAAVTAAQAVGASDEEDAAEADGSGSDEEAMSDEAMFRLDAKLAGYFAALKEGRGGGGGTRTARQELVNFKMRVAALLEAFCKRVPASPLLPAAVAPLLAALASTSRPGGHQPLAERLSGLITHKLCGSKAAAAGAGLTAEEVEQQLRRTLYLASRATDKRVAAAASTSYIFLQRMAAASPAADCQTMGLESACAALADYLVKKKTRLQRPLLESLLRRVPALVPGLLPDLLRQATAARNEYLRLEAFLLLAVALKVGRGGVPAALSSHGTAAAAAVLAAMSGQYSKPQRQMEALKVACELLECGKAAKLVGGKGGSGWQEVWQATESALDATVGHPKLAAALQRLEGLLPACAAPASAQASKRAKLGSKAVSAAKKQKV